jgi:hypothetical protein
MRLVWPSPALLGKVARSDGWGMARCFDAGRTARPSLRTCVDPDLLSTPHPALRATASRRRGAPFRRANQAVSRSCLGQRRPNALDHDRQSAYDELVWKSKNAKSRASKPCIPFGVLDLRICRFVRAAVRFDDDFSRKTNEIREIGSDRGLPAKAVSADLMIPHRAPKHGLRPRHVLTPRPSELARGLTEARRFVRPVYLSQA